MSTSSTIAPEMLQTLLDGGAPIALLDVREKIAAGSGHILGSSNVPRRLLEERVGALVPLPETLVVVVDQDGSMAAAAAADLRAVGYRNVQELDGGFDGWAAHGLPTSQGHSVPSKDFGELVQEFEQIPTVTAEELQRWMDEGRRLELCDVRTPEEHARETLPGSRNFAGFELPARAASLDPDSTVIVHCSGRTRSIIGAATLRYTGMQDVVALENGTMGWTLAGNTLDHGAARDAVPSVPRSSEIAPRWRTLAASVGATFVPAERVARLRRPAGERLGTVYLFDVRTEDEYRDGHAAGAVWAPSGQLVQLTDAYVAVRNATVVVMCDDEVRSSIVAYWLRRLGMARVVVAEGGIGAHRDAGLPVETGVASELLGLGVASTAVPRITPEDLDLLRAGSAPIVVDVSGSDEFAQEHVPGARWVSPTWLESRLAQVAPDRAVTIVVTGANTDRALLAAWKAQRAGWDDVRTLVGGNAGWRAAGFGLEKGPTDVANPDDVFVHPIFRGPEAMLAYLAWEETLGHKYADGDRSAAE